MKKNMGIIMLVILFAGTSLVYARGKKDDMSDKGMKGGMMGGGMMEKGMMDGKMSGMHSMMKSMMERSIIATSDGGIVIVIGNKMTKYDKDLNVVKEVELKMDMEGMQKMMDDMKSMCPMMGKGMGKGTTDKDDDDADENAAEKAEHESHHPENR